MTLEMSKVEAPLHIRGASAARAAFWPALVAVPAALALALHSFGRSRTVTALASLGAALGLGAVRWQLGRIFRERTRYVVERRIGDVEIRHYPPQMIVETTVTHRTFGESLVEGLARVWRWAAAEHVPTMTPLTATCDGGGITIALPLPWRLDLVPDPSDARVVVREQPSRHVAVLRYRGARDDARAHAMQKELRARLAKLGIDTRGDPWVATYDAPTTLPLLRRLEACVELAQ